MQGQECRECFPPGRGGMAKQRGGGMGKKVKRITHRQRKGGDKVRNAGRKDLRVQGRILEGRNKERKGKLVGIIEVKALYE